MEVLDADDAVLGELYTSASSSPHPEPTANDTTVNSAGMQSMTSNTTGNSVDAICSKNAYMLPLQPGQNVFSIVVSPPEPSEQVCSTSPDATVWLCTNPAQPCKALLHLPLPCVLGPALLSPFLSRPVLIS